MITIIQTIIPISLLIGLGVLSRKIDILRKGDERVLNSYIYYFAIPSLLFINIAQTDFTFDTIKFIIIGILPIFIFIIITLFISIIFKIKKETVYLIIITSIFGSTVFFGIPFIIFAYPNEGETLAALAASFIGVISVSISITLLELYKLKKTDIRTGLKHVTRRLMRNPIIISILLGIISSIIGLNIPTPILTPLHMIGKTTATIAIFMLGVFLYGRSYTKLGFALKLSLIRIILLPLLTMLMLKLFFNLTDIKSITITVMHGTPAAISLIVLSERYSFYKNIIASTILISSLISVISLNIWIFILNIFI